MKRGMLGALLPRVKGSTAPDGLVNRNEGKALSAKLAKAAVLATLPATAQQGEQHE